VAAFMPAITAIHATPAGSSTTITTTGEVTVPTVSMARPKTTPARATIREADSRRRKRGMSSAPATEPTPAAPSRRPYPPASSPSRSCASGASSAQSTFAGVAKITSRSRMRRTTGAWRT
jgi:hypothetical protein